MSKLGLGWLLVSNIAFPAFLLWLAQETLQLVLAQLLQPGAADQPDTALRAEFQHLEQWEPAGGFLYLQVEK